MISPTKFFQTSGNVLQFVLPIAVGIQDVVSKVEKTSTKQRRFVSQAELTLLKILTLIGVQRYGCFFIKWQCPKVRPDGSNNQSFPSGHFMIGAQCAARVFHRDGPYSLTFALTLIGTITIGLGRYLPMKHDLVDLTAGGVLGALLGTAWHHWVK